MLSVFNLVLGLVVAAILVARDRERTQARILERVVTSLLVVTVGFGSFLFFLGHTVVADAVAESIGWPAGNPFQSEVAVANLTIATLGVSCAFFRGGFRLAAVVAFSVQWWGAAVVHAKEMLVAHNFAPNNSGATFWMDVLLPFVVIGAVVAQHRHGMARCAMRAEPAIAGVS